MRGGSVIRILTRCFYSGGGNKLAEVSFATNKITPKNKRSSFWWMGAGFGVGSAIGIAVGFQQIRKTKTIVPNPEEQGPIILSEIPDVKVSRQIKYPTDASGLKITLFQYQTCPFCCKVCYTFNSALFLHF